MYTPYIEILHGGIILFVNFYIHPVNKKRTYIWYIVDKKRNLHFNYEQKLNI